MQTQFKSIDDFKSSLATDPSLQQAFKDDPVKAVDNIQETPLNSDKWIYRIVVGALGGSVLLIIIGVILMVVLGGLKNDQIPTILTAIGSAAIGALAGLLAPSPKQ